MKQVVQSYRTGELKVADIPAPQALPGTVLVRTGASLVSAGTEKMAMDLARKSLVGKAMDRPDLVDKVLQKVRKDGVVATAKTVMTKLDVPIPLGYSLAGTIIEVGEGVTDFHVGDRVACAGAKVANHAEFNAVPTNLVARVPEKVSDEHACFVTLGAIALHGLRCAQPTLGERVVVIGLGLIGQLALQLARAHGCRTLGIDLDPKKVALAKACGADAALVRGEDVEGAVARMTDGKGADIVLICAATDSNDPVELAAALCRDRGRVISVGAVNLDLPRRPFFDKEITFLVSRSYGPGRYDPTYEEKGVDYPIGYVRWTEGRNLQAFIDLCEDGRLNLAPLITHRYAVVDAEAAYQLISTGSEFFLGVVLTFPSDATPSRTVEVKRVSDEPAGRVRVGVVGAGAFATAVLVPALAKAEHVVLGNVASARGISARHLAERHGFARCSSDEKELLADRALDAVVIATRHDLHAQQVLAALDAGKHVFVEKPLALTLDETRAIRERTTASGRALMVGYNRRFAPLARKLAAFFADRTGPLMIQYRVNAGAIPADSWVHDPAVGGGRIIGEGCHFVDFASFLAGAPVTQVQAMTVSGAVAPTRDDDQMILTLTLADGSIATIVYGSGGDPGHAKERVEVMGGGRLAILEDFRSLELSRGGKRKYARDLVQDKGHRAELQAFVEACRTGTSPIPLDSLVATSLATFGALESARTGRTIRLDVTACALS